MIKLYLTTLFYFLIIDTIGIQTFVVRIYNKNLPDNLNFKIVDMEKILKKKVAPGWMY